MRWQLTEDIYATLISKDTFEEGYKFLAPVIFDDQPIFEPIERQLEEQPDVKALLENQKNIIHVHAGIYDGEKLIGFHWGFQESLSYYMARTGIHPAYQNKGLYKSFLSYLLEHVKTQGFQCAYSRHILTHNQVIVPKLKSGFVLSKFELSEYFGVLVQLSYYFNPKRRQMLDYRAGKRPLHSPLDKELQIPGP